ncbi:MAG TPA: polyketide synthase dehydratase domain-containing protein, partial [Ktedonobacterales bacterium]|nr:polyketide synthase dehydratase domain-containing protein [Ktedonobacterales bacterium]
MQAFLEPRTGPQAGRRLRYPLLGHILAHTAREQLLAERMFDPAVDTYLLDHTLGRQVSEVDPALHGIAMMPLAMTMELLAEGAAYLMGGPRVIGFEDVRAARWLVFEGAPRTLRIAARRIEPRSGQAPRVAVQVHDASAADSTIAEATVVLGTAYPPPPPARIPAADHTRSSRWQSPETIYREGMFHGPAWQAVVRLNGSEPSSASGVLRVLPAAMLLRARYEPQFEIDPQILDAAGQVIGLWAAETLERGHIVFPFSVRRLDLQGPAQPAHAELTCAAAIRLIGDRQLESDIDVAAANGSLWMRLTGWQDVRFDVPPQFARLVMSSGRALLATADAVSSSLGPGAGHVVRVVLDVPFGNDAFDAFWMRVWAGVILSRAERQHFAALALPLTGQLEWLAERNAAKDAVREVLSRAYRLQLRASDVELAENGRGQLSVR